MKWACCRCLVCTGRGCAQGRPCRDATHIEKPRSISDREEKMSLSEEFEAKSNDRSKVWNSRQMGLLQRSQENEEKNRWKKEGEEMFSFLIRISVGRGGGSGGKNQWVSYGYSISVRRRMQSVQDEISLFGPTCGQGKSLRIIMHDRVKVVEVPLARNPNNYEIRFRIGRVGTEVKTKVVKTKTKFLPM